MLSRNYLIQGIAAKGLAKLRENESIPLIIQACEGALADAAQAIAVSLLFFNDPRAQLASERFIADKRLVDEYRKNFKERGPDGLF